MNYKTKIKTRHPGISLDGIIETSHLALPVDSGLRHAGMTVLIFMFFLVSALGVSISQASNKKVGTTGAQFLKIGAGARPTAMGDAYVAVSEDVNSVYFNPAGIANISRSEMSVMHTQWIGNSNYDFGAFCYPTDHGAFAFSAATLKVNDIDRRGSDEVKTGSFEATDAAYGLSYARNLSPLLSLGFTGRFIQQKIDSTSASTFAGDIGIIKRLRERPISFGLAAKHMGQPVEFKNESDPLPMTIDAGVAASFWQQALLITADARWRRDNDPGYGVGVEYKHQFSEKHRFALRSGYNSTATDSDGSGITLGGGVGLGRLDMDFAWVPFADLGNTYRYALRIRF